MSATTVRFTVYGTTESLLHVRARNILADFSTRPLDGWDIRIETVGVTYQAEGPRSFKAEVTASHRRKRTEHGGGGGW